MTAPVLYRAVPSYREIADALYADRPEDRFEPLAPPEDDNRSGVMLGRVLLATPFALLAAALLSAYFL